LSNDSLARYPGYLMSYTLVSRCPDSELVIVPPSRPAVLTDGRVLQLCRSLYDMCIEVKAHVSRAHILATQNKKAGTNAGLLIFHLIFAFC